MASRPERRPQHARGERPANARVRRPLAGSRPVRLLPQESLRPTMKQRRFVSVPRSVLILLALAFAGQILFAVMQPRPQARAELLPSPPPTSVLRAISLGDPIPLAQLTTLWLQA